MKNTILFLAAMLVLFTGCNKYDDDISRIDKILEQLTHGSITSIEQQVQNISASVSDLQKVDAELKDLIASLESGGNEQATFLAELKAKDAELEKTIVALQAYVDGGMDDMEGWANATFATLEQYADVQMWIEALKVAISNLNKWNDETDQLIGMLVEDLLAAIKASETSMKAWVNGVLADGYYDIAEIDAQLNALETQLTTADADLKKQIADQKAALEKAKTDLTAAYKKAIEDAINDNNGKITEQIAAAVATAQDCLQAQIDTINGKISGIESRLADVESKIDALIDQIQSVTFIPQYSDGKVELDYSTRATSLDFMINPQRLSIALVSAWENNKGTENSIIKAYVRYTDDPTTRAGNTPTELAVSAVTASEGGMINIIVKDNDPSLLIEDFWNGNKEAVIYIVITNGITEIASEAIPMIAHNYAGNTNTIGGFGDGDTQSGEAGQ